MIAAKKTKVNTPIKPPRYIASVIPSTLGMHAIIDYTCINTNKLLLTLVLLVAALGWPYHGDKIINGKINKNNHN